MPNACELLAQAQEDPIAFYAVSVRVLRACGCVRIEAGVLRERARRRVHDTVEELSVAVGVERDAAEDAAGALPSSADTFFWPGHGLLRIVTASTDWNYTVSPSEHINRPPALGPPGGK